MRIQLRMSRIAVVVMVLALSCCGDDTTSSSVEALEGTWNPIQLLGRDYSTFVPVNGEKTITLSPSTRQWSGNDGCNEHYGPLDVDAGGGFSAESQSGTDVGCDLRPAQVLPNIDVVERAATWGIEDGRLVLRSQDGRILGLYSR